MQKREKVRRVAVAMIDDFPEHPFKVKDDEEMEKLKDSISLYGVLTPVVARRCENGRYELISGHTLFARNVNRADDVSVTIVDIEKLRTS